MSKRKDTEWNRRNISQEYSKINNNHKTTDTDSSENTKQDKFQNMYTKAYQIQTAENRK